MPIASTKASIIALIWVMKQDDGFYLSFPSGLVDVVTQRLTMFKMMSAVEITDVSNELIQLGVIDEGF
jgi:Aminomethyltransferase folate-binding domain.